MPEVDQPQMRPGSVRSSTAGPPVGLAVGVVRNGSLEFFHGHRAADIASNTTITKATR